MLELVGFEQVPSARSHGVAVADEFSSCIGLQRAPRTSYSRIVRQGDARMANNFVYSDDPALRQAITDLVALLDKRLPQAAGAPMEFMLFAVNASAEVKGSIAFNRGDP